MAYENSAGLGVHNHYGPRVTGGEQGVYRTAGYANEYVVNLPMSGLSYKFPSGKNQYVYEVDDTFAQGTISAVTIGGVSVLAASASAPVKIPSTNSGVVAQTGGTGGTLVIRYKNVAEPVEDRIDSLLVSPATATIAVAGTQQLTVAASPDGADDSVTWSSAAPSKATVSASGLVTGVATGSAVITATSKIDGSVTSTSTITVS